MKQCIQTFINISHAVFSILPKVSHFGIVSPLGMTHTQILPFGEYDPYAMDHEYENMLYKI